MRLVGWYEHSPGLHRQREGLDDLPDVRDHDDELRAGHNYHQDNYNDGDTYGGRALLKIDLNDSWSIMPGVMGQVADFNGLNAYDHSVGDLELTHFFKETSHDSWVQASLTVQGKIGNWDMTYAGAYLDRNDETRSDYSDYAYWYDVCCGYGTYMRYNDAGELHQPGAVHQGQGRLQDVEQRAAFQLAAGQAPALHGRPVRAECPAPHRAALHGR